MKGQAFFPLLIVLLLVFSNRTLQGEAERSCSKSIPLEGCSKEECVLECVRVIGVSINGCCIDEHTCCCIE
ncbi:hypothetical protein D8674_032772 [Pyrus ussuriensis x Pyrus communis]|uniref:Uncharacterized protein n=1 Tax=Pyrus ussuriensis x Pyrus communis TaxID=2448454 RepID=A0A5N5HMD3_9ROSA|nr:hypothetical protein D8674_032772 [Pyrus ussuriensis x Pyrus communis]